MPEKVKFGVGDVTVISILWSYELVNYWFQSLSRYTSQVLFPDEELQSARFQVNLTWIFFTSCSAILIVALLVEAFDHKYAVSLTGLCLCLSTPFIAVFTCITKFVPAAILMFWTASTIFVVSPATYSLVFNQNLDPVRRQVRYLVSFFEFIESLCGKYLIFLCIPHTASGTEHELYLLIVVWVIVTPLLVTLITLVERIKNHVTGDFINERGIKKILYGIHSDMKIQPPRRKGRSFIEVIFFVLLLLPALSLTSLDAALSNVNSDDDTNTQSPKLKHILFSFQVMAIPFTELVLSLTPILRETTNEMMILGMAHVFNIAVVSILIFRMDHIPKDRGSLRREFRGKRDAVERQRGYLDIELPQPGPGFATFIIFSALGVRMKTEPPALFDNGKDTRELGASRIFFGQYDIPLNKTSQTILFTITPLQSGSEGPPSVQRNITLFEKKHYVYFITGNSTNTRCGEVLGMESIKPKAAPQLMFLNSFTDEVIDGIPVVLSDNKFRINSTEKGFDEYYPLPRVGTYSVMDLPVGEVEVSYMYSGTDTRLVDRLGTDSVRVTTEPFDVYLAFLLRTKEMRLNLVKTLKTPPVTTTTTTPATTTTTMTTTTTSPVTTTTTPPLTRTTKKNLPKPIPKEPDVFQQSSYALLGATLGIASVGYGHFFWVESPLRMRAALYALFKVSTNLVGWFTEKTVGDTLSRSEAIGLLSLEVVTTVWHLGLSWVFQARIRPD